MISIAFVLVLIIAFESGIEVDGTCRFDLRHLHDEVFREIVFKTDEKCIVVNGIHFFCRRIFSPPPLLLEQNRI